MIKANSKIKLNIGKIKQLSKGQITALEQTADAMIGEIRDEQVIPRDKGTLQGESFFADYSESKSGKVSLVHSEPYARRLYFHPEYDFSTDENPNAKGEWLEDWLKGGSKSDAAMKLFKMFYKKAGGL